MASWIATEHGGWMVAERSSMETAHFLEASVTGSGIDRITSISLLMDTGDESCNRTIEALTKLVAKSTRLCNLEIRFPHPCHYGDEINVGASLCLMVETMTSNSLLPLVRFVLNGGRRSWFIGRELCIASLIEKSPTLRCVSIDQPCLIDVNEILPALNVSVTIEDASFSVTYAYTGDFVKAEEQRTAARAALFRNWCTGQLFATPPVDIGYGQHSDSGGDLATLPNEVLCMVAVRFPWAFDLIQLSHTCRLLRDVALANYVLQQRYPPLARRMPWVNRLRHVFRECITENVDRNNSAV